MDKKANFNAWYLMIAVLAMVVIQGLWQQAQRTEYLPYSEFETYLKDGKIDNLTITETRIIGELKGAEEGQPTSFVTTRVDPEFARQLQQYGVEFTGGYRFNRRASIIPYVGGGIGSYGYKETSEFSDPSEDVDLRHAGYLVVGGADPPPTL